MLDISIISEEDLTDEDLNYLKKDERNEDYNIEYLKIVHEGKIIALREYVLSDEVPSFDKASIIEGLIEKVYKLGYEDGFETGLENSRC